MKRNKYKDYLWYTALAVFIICVIEGIFFYHNVENPFLKVTLNIQNAIKAYKIDPDIKQAEALAAVPVGSNCSMNFIAITDWSVHSCYLFTFCNTSKKFRNMFLF